MPDFNALLMNPAEVGAGWTASIMQGREDQRIRETQRALGEYARNQSPESAANVTQHDPMLGLQLQDREEARRVQQMKEQEAAREKQLIGAALNGNPQAREALAYVNADWYVKLDDRGKKQVDMLMDAIAQEAFSILQLPPAQQGPALQRALASLQMRGVDTSQFVLTGNPENDLKTALALAGKLQEFENFAQIRYQQQGQLPSFPTQFGRPLNNQPQEGETRNVGGKTYYFRNGKWYDDPGPRNIPSGNPLSGGY